MIKMLWVAGLMAGTALVSGRVMADDQLMILYPHQRESHQNKMDQNALKYQMRGQDYVEHLYATGGEEQISEPDDFMTDLETDTVPVDAGQVANIIKDDGNANQDDAATTSLSSDLHLTTK